MPQLFGRDHSRCELLELVGDMSQVAGVTRLEYTEGPERGVEVLRFRTGSGLDFDVLPSRGMDVAHASYKGRPLAWMSATGVRHPAFYEPEGLGWLRGFYGGLLCTCGLLNAGGPGNDPLHYTVNSGAPTEEVGTVKLGLHGRVNNTPARGVSADASWSGEEYSLVAEGRVREAIVFGENVELKRQVAALAGQSIVRIVDEVTNHGHDSQPHMMLYHINLGWPVVSPTSRVILSSHTAVARDDVAAPGLPFCREFEPPRATYPEQVFYHEMLPDENGACQAAVINPDLGFGVGIQYHADTLDQFVQWKSMKRGTYVCGLEPANCRVTGRADERAAGRLKVIEPGQSLQYVLDLEVIDGQAQVDWFRQRAER